MSRRNFLGTATGTLAFGGCAKKRRRSEAPKMIVLGVDGMDPRLTKKFMQQGLMPNCQRLSSQGAFRRLQTSNPPQSPVAWSNFISGTNPGGHGIFDFIARDPETMLPFQSTVSTGKMVDSIKLGKWQMPLAKAELQNRRKGPTFWNQLVKHGVETTVFRVPANFPPTDSEATTVSGMGTPDLQGGYGIFTYFTDDPKQRTRDVAGGHIERVEVRDHVVQGSIQGPENPFSADQASATVPITVYIDPQRPVAKVVIQNSEALLKEGEWSEWLPLKFSLIPQVVEVSGICRLLLKRVHGGFGLYVSPINIDPSDPSMPLSTPPDYTRQLVREEGYFYTQGMIEDTHALSAGVLTADEYRQQVTFAIEERMRFFEHELGRFNEGFLFFYFSSLDLSSHVFWRTLDPGHPLYSETLAKQHSDFIPELYAKIDRAVGQVLELADDDTTVMVMSDHGFTSFRRQFNLNSWLMDNGYVRQKVSANRGANSFFQDVEWNGTRAYGLGINGLYLNLKGREIEGGVAEGNDAEQLTDELITRLKSVRDPDTDQPVISDVLRSRDIYSGPYVAESPDLIVAYNENYRASWDTVLGGFPRQHVLDNTDAWSGDHCIDARFVPGVLLCNRPVHSKKLSLIDLAPTILTQFGAAVPTEMTGSNFL